MNIVHYNSTAWDNLVKKNDRWTVPVNAQEINAARNGEIKIVLTPIKPVPAHWFPNLHGAKVLCLASGGGQQGPILAAAGAEVIVFDNSVRQLQQDELIAQQHHLPLTIMKGDMRDLSALTDASFDLVFNPVSNCFVEDVLPVWQECYRVLKKGGTLLAGFFNPVTLQLEPEGEEGRRKLVLAYKQPYSDLKSISQAKLHEYISKNEPLIFGHSLTDQIGGQLKAGFQITDLYEDCNDAAELLDEYMPGFIATKAIKY